MSIPKDAICHKHLIKGCTMCVATPETTQKDDLNVSKQIDEILWTKNLSKEQVEQYKLELYHTIDSEIIGEDEPRNNQWGGASTKARVRNDFREKQRQKLNSLLGEK